MVSNTAPVSKFFAATAAFGTTAPLGSVTTPLMPPVVKDWAALFNAKTMERTSASVMAPVTVRTLTRQFCSPFTRSLLLDCWINFDSNRPYYRALPYLACSA